MQAAVDPRFRRALAVVASVALLVGCQSREPGRSPNVPDIPVYPGAKLDQRVAADATAPPTLEGPRDPIDFYVIAHTDAQRVLAWYSEQMPEHGWAPVTDSKEDVVLYTTAAGCYGFVVVTQVERDVELQISQQNPATPCEITPTEDPGDR